MGQELGLFEAIYRQRAIRHLKPDPVPDELIRKVLDAGIRAPNGGNAQRWAFIVIKDKEMRRKIAERYRNVPVPPHPAGTTSQKRADESADYLTQHLAEVPVFILVCIRHDGSPSDIQRGASIYPAVQNMLLAAQGLGLGSTMTTRQRRGFESEIKEWLGIPENVETAALLPLGYLQEGTAYGPTTRKPVEEVAYAERWGEPWAAAG